MTENTTGAINVWQIIIYPPWWLEWKMLEWAGWHL
jgi:hypothetical protein